MKELESTLNSRRMAVATLVAILGRLALGIGMATALAAWYFSHPIYPLGALLVSLVAIVSLGTASILFGDALWLGDVVVQSVALSVLLLTCLLARVALERGSDGIPANDWIALGLSASTFVACVIWLRRK